MTAQLWRCPRAECEKEYWSPMAVQVVACPGPHDKGTKSVHMELVADGDEAEAASPFREEAVTTVRRGARGG
jgi:hypothetical protein